MTKADVNKVSQISSKKLKKLKLTGLNGNEAFVQINANSTQRGSSFLKHQPNRPLLDENNKDECYDNFIKFIGNNNPAYYAMNFQHQILQNRLSKFSVNIHTDVNQLNDEGVGLNTSSFYLAGPLAITPMHIEDGNLDAVNLIIYGDTDAVKLWMIIHPGFSHCINHIVALELSKNRDSEDDKIKNLMQKWPLTCSFPLHHKSLVLTTKFLQQHKIIYDIIIQRPGDLIYIRPSIYHQVVNSGVTLAEAINVGSALWLATTTSFSTCICQDQCIDYIIPNLNETDNKIQVVQSSLLISCNFCRAHFNTQIDLLEHMKLHEKFFICDICSSHHRFKRNLQSHMERRHINEPKRAQFGYKTCHVCQNPVEKNEFANHLASCDVSASANPSLRCKWCEYTSLVPSNVRRHEKTCKKATIQGIAPNEENAERVQDVAMEENLALEENAANEAKQEELAMEENVAENAANEQESRTRTIVALSTSYFVFDSNTTQ